MQTLYEFLDTIYFKGWHKKITLLVIQFLTPIKLNVALTVSEETTFSGVFVQNIPVLPFLGSSSPFFQALGSKNQGQNQLVEHVNQWASRQWNNTSSLHKQTFGVESENNSDDPAWSWVHRWQFHCSGLSVAILWACECPWGAVPSWSEGI